MRWIAALGCASSLVGCGPSVATDMSGSSTSTTSAADEDAPPRPTSTTVATSAGDETTASTRGTSQGANETTTDGGAAESSDESPFVRPMDIAGLNIECDLWAQDCRKGQKCMPWDEDGGMVWNARECRDLAAMPGAVGDPCIVEGTPWSGIDDCQISAMCWNVNPETNVGECVGFCVGSEANAICDGDDVCFQAYPYGSLGSHIILCLPACDPLTPNCEVGFACVESDSESVEPQDLFACVPQSLVADRSAYGNPCDEIIGCGSGLFCTAGADVPGCAGECCTSLCDPLAANTCPDAAAGQVCIAHESGLGHCGVR